MLRLHGFSHFPLFFILGVQSLELLPPTVGQPRALVGTHQAPILIRFHSVHKQVADPEGIKKVPCAIFIFSVVLSQIEERVNVRVPRFQIHRDGSLPFATSLIDIPRGIVVHPQHRNDPVRSTVGAANVRVGRANIGDVQTDTTGVFGDDRTAFQSIVDTRYGIFLHGEKETGTHLRLGRAGVEKRGGGMGEVFERHQIVRLKNFVQIVAVNADRHPHDHVLRSFGHLAMDFEQV
mmetsp:Transcript_15377/g.34459  ORF Transcript_15377/g.34459 Transcript_15377/m.34459 type:complete len:235 (+) Transcript_15377:1377-2081(+)